MKTLVDIPEDTKRKLKARAAREGMTFGDLIRAILKQHTRSGAPQPAERVNQPKRGNK